MSEAFENVRDLHALGLGLEFFPFGGRWGEGAPKRATSDLSALESMLGIDPKVGLKVRCNSTLCCIVSPTFQSYKELTQAAGCRFPDSLMSKQGRIVRWYRIDNIELPMESPLLATKCTFSPDAIVPGSRDKKGELVEWIFGPRNLRLATLPRELIDKLREPGITREVVERYEWTPEKHRATEWSDYAPDPFRGL